MAGPAPRRSVATWWPWLLFIAGVGTLGFFTIQPARSEQERRLVGVWVGLDTRDPEEPYAWRADLKEDGTLQIQFRHYSREEPPEATAAPEQPAGDRWTYMALQEAGRWRVADGFYIVDSWHPEGRRGFWDKLQYFRHAHQWLADEIYHEEYLIEHMDEREFRIRGKDSGALFQARRASPQTELPAQPLPPEQWVK